MTETSRAAEMAARNSYGRLLAFLSARTHDIAQAEDALADAFAKALANWPKTGVPNNPDAWLLTVARNRLTDRQRQQIRFPTENEMPDIPSQNQTDSPLPDRRLCLLMVCAHPTIATDLHTPLMLQTVLGLKVNTIARLFLISPTVLSKRLVRAKAKIRDAGIPFQIPDDQTLPKRSTAILEALYALHAHDWLDPCDTMGDEALYLADLLTKLMPDNPEGLGLVALIAFGHARVQARIIDNVLVPIHAQNTALWDEKLIRYGKQHLARAYRLAAIGRFQIEAAIDAVHIARKETNQTDWVALNKLYHAFLKNTPSAGALVAQAAVTGRLYGPKVGLQALEAVENTIGTAFQPLWAVRAEMNAQLGQKQVSSGCYEKAISLATDVPTINLLRRKQATLLVG